MAVVVFADDSFLQSTCTYILYEINFKIKLMNLFTFTTKTNSMSEYTSFCVYVNKSTSCTKKANYIYEKDDQKYCLRHLVSVFNQFHLSKDPAFKKCTKLSEIYGYEKITKSKKKDSSRDQKKSETG
jgi:hypothetical protein